MLTLVCATHSRSKSLAFVAFFLLGATTIASFFLEGTLHNVIPTAGMIGALVIAVAIVFGLVTLITMLAAVFLTSVSIRKMPSLGRWEHAVAGASVAACGAAISFIGL